MSNILLLEDDQSLGATLFERLDHMDYDVKLVRSIRAAQLALETQVFDLLVLDVGLPDGSGFDFAQTLQGRSAAPFIFLTAQSSALERLKGYELGAAEFIPKPFAFKELLLRIQHVLNDQQHTLQTIQCDDRTINLETMSVTDGDGKITYLTNRDFKLLSILIRQAPRPVSRDEILDELCGQDQFPSNRTIDNSVVRLRQILGEVGGQFIRSIRSVGYQWIPIKKEKP